MAEGPYVCTYCHAQPIAYPTTALLKSYTQVSAAGQMQLVSSQSSGKCRGPSQGAWGNLLFLLLLNEVPFATGAVKVLIALVFFFSFKLSFVEKLRDVRT